MADEYDIFVSYSRADNENGWISGFIDALQAEQRKFTGDREFKMFFDKDDIKSLDDWQRRINTGLYGSRMLVAFISPRYFASDWCRREWRTWIDVEISKHILSDGAAPIYIVQVPWLDNKQMSAPQVSEEIARIFGGDVGSFPPGIASDAIEVGGQVAQRQLTQARNFFGSGIDSLRTNDLQKVLNTLAKELYVKAAHVEASARSENTIPAYNRRFVGRLKELIELRNLLDRGRTGVISGHRGDPHLGKVGVASVHGLGGIGKTELAFTYAHAFAGLYPGGRFLVSCEGVVDLRRGMLTLDPLFQDKISDEQRKSLDLHFGAIREGLRDRLRKVGRVLLILDNVSDLALIQPEQLDHLRTLGSDLHLLATTRHGATENSGGTYDDVQWLTLGELSFEDSLRLLEKHRPFPNEEEQAAAEQIARRLGGFALCVEIVGAYLGQHSDETYSSYLGLMGLTDLEQVDITAERKDVTTRRHNNEKRLDAILAPTLATLPPECVCALGFAAFLPADSVPLPWLQALVGDRFPQMRDRVDGTANHSWDAVPAKLAELALFTRMDHGSEGRVVRIHRLVQEVAKKQLWGDDERQDAPYEIHAVVHTRDEALPLELQMLRDSQWEVDAMEALSGVWESSNHTETGWLMNQVACRYLQLAEFSRAEGLYERAIAFDEQMYGPLDSRVAVRHSNYGSALRGNGNVKKAEFHLRRALEINSKVLSPTDVKLATDLGKLAQLLRSENRLEEAERLLRQSLRFEGDPNASNRMSDLAIILARRGQYEEAERTSKVVLEAVESMHGRDSVQVGIELQNLAGYVEKNGRIVEAVEFAERAVSVQERACPNHPQLASALNDLALLKMKTSCPREAETSARRALEIMESHFPGQDHVEVGFQLNTLAWILKEMNRLSEAEPLFLRTIAIFTNAYGAQHHFTITSAVNLVDLYVRWNSPEDAIPLILSTIETLCGVNRDSGIWPDNLDGLIWQYRRLSRNVGVSDHESESRLIGVGVRREWLR